MDVVGLVFFWFLANFYFICLFAACICGVASYSLGVFTAFVIVVVLGVWAGPMLTRLHFSAC